MMSKPLWLLALVLTTGPVFGALPAPSPLANPSPFTTASAPSADPYETANRQVFAFNAWLTSNIIGPAAEWLDWLVPTPVQEAGYNMYNNLVEPKFIVNNLVAGNLDGALVSGERLMINTTIGVAGIWDAASWLGYERHEVEPSDSVCAVGVDPGDFIVLPLIGPTTMSPLMLEMGVFAAESYLIPPLLDPTMATSRFVLSIGAAAFALRQEHEPAASLAQDDYRIRREEFLRDLSERCPTAEFASL